MTPYDAGAFTEFVGSPAYAFASRLGYSLPVIADWDDDLLREPRVCVPIDVQALVVTGDDTTAGVRLDGPLTPGRDVPDDAGAADKRAALIGAEPFADASPRERGIHLHWAMPDALMSGRATDAAPRASGLGMAALPDRWVVTRLLVPVTGSVAVTRSWTIDALTGTVAALGGPSPAPPDRTRALAQDALDGAAGGTLTWTAGYDAARGRFAFHDPQDDLESDPTLGGTLPGGAVQGRATYLVVGWWSDPDLDPLDGIRGVNARGAASTNSAGPWSHRVAARRRMRPTPASGRARRRPARRCRCATRTWRARVPRRSSPDAASAAPATCPRTARRAPRRRRFCTGPWSGCPPSSTVSRSGCALATRVPTATG